jgi:hypothetical protein
MITITLDGIRNLLNYPNLGALSNTCGVDFIIAANFEPLNKEVISCCFLKFSVHCIQILNQNLPYQPAKQSSKAVKL